VSTTNTRNSVSPAVTASPPRLRWLWLMLGLGGVAVVSASAGALLAVAIAGTPLMQARLSPEESKVFSQGDISTGMNFRLPQLTRPVNIVVLGTKVLASDVNNPPPETQNLGYDATLNSLEGLTDSMLLLRFNPADQQLVVLSLPRDTRTYVDGIGITKLNEANAVGGPALAARATSDLLGGVGIDRYVRINVLGVEKLIDALGGITLYVPHDMKYQDDSQHLYINLKQGKQHLNGAQAVQFLRFRYDAYGDIGRVQRQQMFLRALREQALKPATLSRLPQILSVIQSNIDTNLSVEELIALAGFAAHIDRANMQMLMLPGTFSGSEYDASYWLPNAEQIDTLVRQYFGLSSTRFEDPQLSTESFDAHLTVAIQDSTGEPGVVEKLMNTLAVAGYGDVFIDEPWSEPLTTTRIIAQQGNLDEAEALQQSLGFGEVLVESTGSLQSNLTIRLGQDAIQGLLPPASGSPSSPVAPTSDELPVDASIAPPSDLPDTDVSQPEIEPDWEATSEPAPKPTLEPASAPASGSPSPKEPPHPPITVPPPEPYP